MKKLYQNYLNNLNHTGSKRQNLTELRYIYSKELSLSLSLSLRSSYILLSYVQKQNKSISKMLTQVFPNTM